MRTFTTDEQQQQLEEVFYVHQVGVAAGSYRAAPEIQATRPPGLPAEQLARSRLAGRRGYYNFARSS